jgi:P27 family predicted phage terminase small subunit
LSNPKPTALKLLEGNRGHRPINENEPQPTQGAPSCPLWLNSMAKTEWKRIVPELDAIGMLSVVDRVALTAYCQAYARWRKAETAIQDSFIYDFMDKDFKMKRVKKPEVQIAIDSLNQVKAFCVEFGLTPSSRSRISVLPKKDSGDPLDKYLGTRNKN